MNSTGALDCFGLTDPGQVRGENQDHFLIAGLNKSMMVRQTSLDFDDPTRLFGGTHGHLLIVADGMGGHRGGGVASSSVIDSLTHYVLNTMPWFFRLRDDEAEDQLEALEAGLHACQEQLQDLMDGAGERMGTTMTTGYLLWPRLYVVHAGDSRCYLMRDGRLEQITTDHTFAQSLIADGKMDAQEARNSRWSHVLWNALGGNTEEVLPDAYKVELRIGDTLLFCTDGLTSEVTDAVLLEILQAEPTAKAAARRLVEAANEAGGKDNITAVVARFLDEHPPSEAADVSAVERGSAAKDTPAAAMASIDDSGRTTPALDRGNDS